MTILDVAFLGPASSAKINEIIAQVNANTDDLAAFDLAKAEVESGTYTPAWTNLAVGTGGSAANSAGYRFIGGSAVGDRGFLGITGSVILGTSGASVTGAPNATLPTGFEMQTAVNSASHRLGLCTLVSASIGVVQRVASEPDKFGLTVFNASGTYLTVTSISSTVPATWAAGDFIRYDFFCSAIRV